MSTFNPIRRLFTTHHPDDVDGSHVIVLDSSLDLVDSASGTTAMTAVFASVGFPVVSERSQCTKQVDASLSLAQNIVTPGGVNGRVVEMLPGSTFPMHRTSSLDYNIILSGSAFLVTPTPLGDKKLLVRPGDVVIQTGTLHAWEAGPEGARWFSVIVNAEPVMVGNQPLKEVSL